MRKIRQGKLLPDLFLLFEKASYEMKASVLHLSFDIFPQSSTCHAIKANCIKLQIIDPEMCSILIFQKKVWNQFLHHILCMIFQEKCSSCYILLTDQIALSACFCFSRYWAIFALQFFVNQAVTSQNLELTLSF